MAVHCIVLAAVVTLPNGTFTPQGTTSGLAPRLTRLAGAC